MPAPLCLDQGKPQHCLGDAVPLCWLHGGCLQKLGKTGDTGVCEWMDSISSMPKLSEAFFEPSNTSNLCWGESCSSFSTIHPPGLKSLKAAGCLAKTTKKW